MITVKGPDGVTYNFPDEASTAEIEETMKENYSSSPETSSSFQEKIQKMPGLQGSLARGGQYALNRLADVEQGVASAIPGAAQFVTEGLSQALPNGKKIWAKASENTPWLPKPGTDYMQSASKIGSGETGFIPEMTREAGRYLAYGPLGEARAIPQVGGTLAQAFGKSILGQALTGGLYGAVNDQEGNKFKSTLEGAALNVAGAGLGKAALSAFEKLRPSKILRGNLSSAQLNKNLEASKDTKTALGNVIGNRSLQRISENYLPEIPFSGATPTSEKSSNIAQQQAGSFLNRLLGNNSSEDVGGQLQTALKTAKENVRAEKNAKFNRMNEEADKTGQLVDSKNVAKTASDYLNSIKEDPRLALEVPSELMTRLELYANPELAQNFKQTGILRGKLGEKARQYGRQGEDYEAGIYSGLKNSLQKDWDEAIDTTANPNLKIMRDEANRFYKENYAPFKEPEVAKFIDKGGDSDTLLNTFVKTGSGQDRANLLNKLISKLPEEKRGLVPYGYLSKAMEENGLNNSKFATRFKNLGTRQKEVMFPNKSDIAEGEHISNLADMNKKGQYSMLNAETGQKNLGALIKGASASAITAAALSGGMTPAVASALGIWGAARGLNKALTSENLRESLVKEMLKNETKFKSTPQQRIAGQTLAQAAMNAQGNQ